MTNLDANTRQKVQNIVNRGKQALESKRPFAAIQMFTMALELAPQMLEARKNLRVAQILAFKKVNPSEIKKKFNKVKKLLSSFENI